MKAPLSHTERPALVALACLRAARDVLKRSKHPKTLARVRAAISSCKGADRVDDYRRTRAQRVGGGS